MDMGLNGFIFYCAGIFVGIIYAVWVSNCGESNDWRKNVTSKDIEDLGKIFKEGK